jgi:hypothetical protein
VRQKASSSKNIRDTLMSTEDEHWTTTTRPKVLVPTS